MRFQSFIDRLAGWDEQTFLERFLDPFLLEEEVDDPVNRRVYRVRSVDEQPVIIGRDKRCHVRIVDNTISSLHAKLLPPRAPKQPWRIVDNGSSNGTFVDGSAVTSVPVPLPNDTLLGFGSFRQFKFLNARSLLLALPPLKTIAPAPAVRPTDRLSMSATHVDFADSLVVAGTPSAPPEGELLLMCNTLDPIALEYGKPVVVGRSSDADLVLPDNKISRRHAEFERCADGVYVRDLGSANGTFVGGVRISEDWQALPYGRTVSIGRWELHTGAPPSSTQIIQAVPDSPR